MVAVFHVIPDPVVRLLDGTLAPVAPPAPESEPPPSGATLPDANSLAYFARGEPFSFLRGKVTSADLGYFQSGEPFPGVNITP
jgi:hypothetical protein